MQTEPPSSAEETKPDVKPNMEPSPKHQKSVLSQPKMEPLTPKEEVKPKLELSEVEDAKLKLKQVELYTEPSDELLRKENALLRELVTEQRKEIKYLKAMQTYDNPLQGKYWRVIALCSSVTLPGQFKLYKCVIETVWFHGFPLSNSV